MQKLLKLLFHRVTVVVAALCIWFYEVTDSAVGNAGRSRDCGRR